MFFTTILDALGKNSGQLLKSLKCGSTWKLLKKFLMYNIIIKKQNYNTLNFSVFLPHMSSGNLSNEKRSETLSKEQTVHINTK